MRKWILVGSCLLAVLFVGCELFLKPGKLTLQMGGGGSTGSSSLSINSITTSSEANPPWVFLCTLNKVEISKDGSNWIELLDSPVNINSKDLWITYSSTSWSTGSVSVLNSGKELDEGDYYYIRLYFGSDITARAYDVQTGSCTAEKTRTDFNSKLNPLNICYPPAGNLPSSYVEANVPIIIEKGRNPLLIIKFDIVGLPWKVLGNDSDWATYRDSLSTGAEGSAPIYTMYLPNF